MHVFKVETLASTYIVKAETLKAAKEEYNRIYDTFNWINMSAIVYVKKDTSKEEIQFGDIKYTFDKNGLNVEKRKTNLSSIHNCQSKYYK